VADEYAEDLSHSGLTDTSVAHQARIYDYWLGGKNNFAVDREAAEQGLAACPGLRRGVRAQRAFLAHAVGYLAGQAGVRQFLDIGTGNTGSDKRSGCRSAQYRRDPARRGRVA
jgi:S-adenosyl methyltransferase